MSMTETETIEIWQNAGRGLFVVSKVAMDGSTRPEPVQGGREFQVTPADRRHHQALCYNDKQDPFRNGTLRPINEAAFRAAEEVSRASHSHPWSSVAAESHPRAAAAPQPPAQPEGTLPVAMTPQDRRAALLAELAQIEEDLANPGYQVVSEGEMTSLPTTPTATGPYAAVPPQAQAPAAEPQAQAGPIPAALLTQEDEDCIVSGNGNRAKKLLAGIDSAVVLERLAARARTEGSESRRAMIAARQAQVDEFVARSMEPGDDRGSQPTTAPSTEPQSYQLAGVDGESGPVAGADDDETGEVGPGGMIVPGGVPEGHAAPQLPPDPNFVAPD